MRPQGKAAALFEAFSVVNAKAYENERLISCPNLSKAPNYGDVLARFITREDIEPLSLGALFGLAARYVLTNAGHLFYLFLGRLFIFLLKWKTPAGLNSGKVLVVDTFALLHPIAESGRYEERYLPGLAEAATGQGYRPAHLYRLYGPRSPRLLWRALKVLARSGEGLTEMHLFTWADWLRLMRHMLMYPVALWDLIRSLDPAGGASPQAYIRDALIRTAGQCIVPGEARRLAGLRLGLLLAGNSAARICSWSENQTVDKAFQSGLHKARRSTGGRAPSPVSIGAQLLTWPPNLLNNHADDREMPLGLTPDKTLVNGPYFLPDKTRQNYAVGPSLRYASLFETPVESPSLEAPLLVILSYHPDETRQVLKLVRPLADTGQGLAFRFHPATRPQDFQDLLPPRVNLAGGSLYTALAGKCAVIGSGSGALAEAVCLGLPALTLRTDEAGLNYLPEYGKGKLWEEVAAAEDIQTALDRLRAFQSGPEYQQARLAFRALLFTEPTEETVIKAFDL